MYKKLKYAIVLMFFFQGFSQAMATIENTTPSVSVALADITKSPCEAIVNAANEQLRGGAGVCGSIFNAAGWDKLQLACNAYSAHNTVRCPVGKSCITDSFDLKARGIKYIIHAVGPDCRIIKDPKQQDALLESSYNSSLLLADQNDIKSIAFPFISSAIYAFPKERACEIALRTVLDYAKNSHTKIAIHFVLFSQDDYDLFCDMLKKIKLA